MKLASPLLLACLAVIGTGAIWAVAAPGRQAQSGQASADLSPEMSVIPDTPANRRLVAAVLAGDLKSTLAALNSGADPTTRVGNRSGEQSDPIAIVAARDMNDERPKWLPIFQVLVAKLPDPNQATTLSHRTVLMAAVDMNDMKSIRSLVERGADVNSKTTRFPVGANAIYYACMLGGVTKKDEVAAISYLLDHGADPNIADEHGRTPLMLAAEYGKFAAVRTLLAHGAKADARDERGFTALRAAARRNELAIVDYLRDKTPTDLGEAVQFGKSDQVSAALKNHVNVDAKDPEGMTPLMIAARSGQLALAKQLLGAKANVAPKDRDGRTALHWAAQCGEPEIIDLLLKAGANPTTRTTRPAGAHGLTPLLDAVSAAQPTAVARLLRDPRVRPEATRALELAVRSAGTMPSPSRDSMRARRPIETTLSAQDEVILALLRAGASPSGNHSRSLVIASRAGQLGLVQLLISHGADVNGSASPDDGGTPLLGAIDAYGDSVWQQREMAAGTLMGPDLKDLKASARTASSMIDFLIAKGARVSGEGPDGTTPLAACVTNEVPEIADRLLKRGARVNGQNRAGQTALMLAASDNNLKMATYLLKRGANPNLRDRKGQTSLILAVDNGENALFRESRKLFAENAGNHEAMRTPPPNPDGHPAMVKFLLAHGADRDVVAADGTTALSRAKKEGFKGVVAILERH